MIQKEENYFQSLNDDWSQNSSTLNPLEESLSGEEKVEWILKQVRNKEFGLENSGTALLNSKNYFDDTEFWKFKEENETNSIWKERYNKMFNFCLLAKEEKNKIILEEMDKVNY